MELDKVCMYEEMMTNDDNVEPSLLTSSLLKIRSLYKLQVLLQVAHVKLEILDGLNCVEFLHL